MTPVEQLVKAEQQRHKQYQHHRHGRGRTLGETPDNRAPPRSRKVVQHREKQPTQRYCQPEHKRRHISQKELRSILNESETACSKTGYSDNQCHFAQITRIGHPICRFIKLHIILYLISSRIGCGTSSTVAFWLRSSARR